MDYEKSRNPSLRLRVAIVSTLFASLGFISGALLSLFLGAAWFWIPLMVLLAGYCGAKLELGSTLPNSSRKKPDNSNGSQPTKS
jgi:uncharacterized membrane protein YoaK (UPF0700 family)